MNAERESHWQRQRDEVFDVAVIGGGIVGAGVAWEAALRGLRVALVEKEDFASGTSGRSSRMIHGGLRYLEYMHFGLVREASQERGVLLQLAPGLVRRTPFLIPFYGHDRPGPRVMNAGLVLYEILGWVSRKQHHRMLSAGEALRREPVLLAEGLSAATRYYDALCDDARLVWAVVRAASRAGAAVCNYAEVVAVGKDARGRAASLDVRDTLRGRELELRAEAIVNAAGPWADRVRQLDVPECPPVLRPTKGIHLVFPRERFPCTQAIVFSSPRDHRKLFLVPWGRFTYVGTTDTDYGGPPEVVAADADDLDYTLEAMRANFEAVAGAERDVWSSWAGVRNLLRDEEERPGRVSREHRYLFSSSGMLTIAGGKLTTFRRMAEDVIDLLAVRLKRPPAASRSRETPLLPASGIVEETDLTDDVMLHLVRAYGTDAWRLVQRVLDDPRKAERLRPDLPYMVASLDHAIEEEMAQTVSDVLVRRTRTLLEAEDGGLGLAPRVGQALAGRHGWSPLEVERQIEDYRQAVRRSRAFRAS